MCSGTRSFCSVAPNLCSRLPDKLHQAKGIVSFRRQWMLNLCSALLSPSPSSHPLPHIFLPLLSYLPPPFFFSIFTARHNEHLVFCIEWDCAVQMDIYHWHWHWVCGRASQQLMSGVCDHHLAACTQELEKMCCYPKCALPWTLCIFWEGVYDTDKCM